MASTSEGAETDNLGNTRKSLRDMLRNSSTKKLISPAVKFDVIDDDATPVAAVLSERHAASKDDDGDSSDDDKKDGIVGFAPAQESAKPDGGGEPDRASAARRKPSLGRHRSATLTLPPGSDSSEALAAALLKAQEQGASSPDDASTTLRKPSLSRHRSATITLPPGSDGGSSEALAAALAATLS